MKLRKITALASASAVFAAMLVPIAVSQAAETTTTLKVGADETYTTISAAVAAAKEINPQSEDARVTIDVDPGDYEEQVKIEGLKYVTLEQTPGTTGKVNLHWYYCTGYCAGDCGLDGNYDPKINWSLDETWTGYSDGDEAFTKYELGQSLSGVSTISYYDTDGVAHENVAVKKDHLGDFNDQAALYINSSSSDIIVKDFNIVNSIPVMVTEGEKRVGVAPQEDRNADNATSYVLPRRDNLTICDEDTVPNGTSRVTSALSISNDGTKVNTLEALEDLTAEESAYLVRSDKYNERGHAVSANGDRITFDGIRLRGNQDSLYISTGRMYFKDCDLIGGTDYIYGDATAVFDNCKLGAEGMTNRDYGATITAANHDAKNPYGYLFFNCELYNVLDNITNSKFGRPWRQDAQITFYKTVLDDTAETGASAAGIASDGWSDMSGNEAAKARFYEYGTTNKSGKTVDTSKRVECENGFGTVLDSWQILEYNPRNYFNSDFWLSTKGKTEWDPMNFGEEYLSDVDAAIAASGITVPSGEETEVALPTPEDSNIEFKWESASTNAVVSSDGTKLTVVRPAAGEDPIETTVTLYAMDKTTGYGDKTDIPVSIAATTDTTNVFSIPVTVNQSLATSNTYTVTISKEGALIKQQQITASDTVTEAVIEGIPASADGIDYDVTIVSASSEMTVTEPENGTTTVTGITGTEVPITVTALMQVDDTVDLGISYSSTDGQKSYDLIALAKANGAADSIDTSEIITVTYTLDVTPTTSGKSYIDILATEPASSISTSGVTSRFILSKLGHWNQLDMVDSAQSYSGSKNGDDQWLNACGKFTEGVASTASVTIDYKNKTLSASGSGSNSLAEYTFATFPSTYSQGSLYMGIYSGGETFSVSDVKVTYKKLVTDEGEIDKPDPVEYQGLTSVFGTGNQCTGGSFSFVDGADADAAAVFADSDDSTKVKASLTSNYINYIGGTKKDEHPTISYTTRLAGPYKIYYLGYNSGKAVQATINGTDTVMATKADFASNDEKTLQLYTMDATLAAGTSTIVFDDLLSGWLPDLYSVVIVYDGEDEEPSETPTPAPTATPSPAPTATPTPEPTEVPGDGTGIYKYPFDRSNVTGGNQCDNSDSFTILDGADETAAYLFGSGVGTKVDTDLFAHYLNYICGTATNGTHPVIKITAETAGTYDIYLVGYNHGNNVSCTVNGYTYTAGSGVNFASKDSNTSYVLKSYLIENVVLPAAEAEITFDSTDQWLPDTYAVVIAGTAEQIPAVPAIESATVTDGNTAVTLSNITEGTVIAVSYDETGAISGIRTADAAAEVTFTDFAADKVMVWNSLGEMNPICSAANVTVQ